MASGSGPNPLEIRLFGPPVFLLNGEALPYTRNRKGHWLLALLALRGGRAVERDWLAATLWPESTERHARASLRVCLADLRRALGSAAGRLRSPTAHTLCLDLSDCDADLLAFDAALAAGGADGLERAVALYGGPLLEGCAEEWAFQERQPREQAFLTALEWLAATALKAGDPARAEQYLRRAIATDPLRETAQRGLMQALAAGGNYPAALQTYRDLRLRLYRELNTEPDPETRTLFQQLQAEAQERHRTVRSTAASRLVSPNGPSPGVEEKPRHNLQHRSTSFIGREEDIARLQALLLGEALSDGGRSPSDSGSPVDSGPIQNSKSKIQNRLLTLTGAGGCGKSRLVLETGWTLVNELPDGVWLVELAWLADPALLPPQVAAALGVREQPGKPWSETLVSALRSKYLLLVLDNCEHLLAGCVALIDLLLRGCSEVRILTTSREPLGMLGETTYRVPPLSFPGVQGFRGSGFQERLSQGPEDLNTRTPEHLLQYEAVRLFVERAAAASPPFSLTTGNASAVARLCRRLDGIPLALEMAASRARAMPVATLAERLDDRFRLLSDGNRAGLPRHRTLRAMIEWSYDLLPEAEKVLLRRLSVFAGGWTLEAAEAVCGFAGGRDQGSGVSPTPAPLPELTPDPWPLPPDVLDLLTRLVDKSLVVYEDREGQERYQLLETIRQFAQESLAASGEREAIQRRHTDHYLSLAETADPHLISRLDRLEQEIDNLRTVLTWCLEAVDRGRQLGDRPADSKARAAMPLSEPTTNHFSLTTALEVGLRLAAAVSTFWQVRGRATEGRAWLAKLLALAEGEAPDSPLTPVVLAQAFEAAGTLAWSQSDLDVSRTLYQQGLGLAQEIGDQVLVARCLTGLGNLAGSLGQFGAAQHRYEESLAICRELGDRRQIAGLYNNLGQMAREQGDHERARALLEESLRIHRELGDRTSTKNPLCLLGTLSMLQGDYAAAQAYHEESLAISRELGNQRFVAIALRCLGMVARSQGDLETAHARDTEALRLHHALENRGPQALGLLGLGCLAVMTGERAARNGVGGERWFVRGARLFGAGETLRAASGVVIWSEERPSYERCLAVARAALGEEAFTAAWAEGRGMSLDAAVAYALEEGGSSG